MFDELFEAVSNIEGKEYWKMDSVEFYQNVKLGKSLIKDDKGRVKYKYFIESNPEISTIRKGQVIQQAIEDLHIKVIQQALADNKPVPKEVLLDYKNEPWAKEALDKLENK